MTVLGAVVFGGILVLGVLWLLVTAPDSEVDHAWNDAQPAEHAAPGRGVLTSAQ